MAQVEPIWYNCLTREVFTPEKQAWCDRWQTLQAATYIVPISPEPDPAYATLTLSYGRYEAASGQLLVKLVNQEGWITFGDLTGNGQEDAAACLDDVEAQEQAVLAALQQVKAYGIANGELQLLDGEGNRWLTFEQAPSLALTHPPLSSPSE